MLIKRLEGLRQDWPDALRMVVSTVLLETLGKDLHDLIRVLQGPR